jgi:hypothetical protein
MDIGDLFSFDKMVAPSIVKPLYWILLLLIIVIGGWGLLSGVWSVLSGVFTFTGHSFWGGWGRIIGSIVFIAVSVPVLRIAAEVTLALFEVREKLKGGDTQQVS